MMQETNLAEAQSPTGDHEGAAREGGAVSGAASDRSAMRRPRAVTALLVLVALLLAAAGVGVLALPNRGSPGTPLGAAASVEGGLARVNGILPLEIDGWRPPDDSAGLEQSARPGTHRVRILLELTATDPQGIRFASADYSVTGLGSGEPPLLWSDPGSATVLQGTSVTTTLVFEIPNQAVELTLEGPGGTLLALGTGHHTPGS